MRLTIAISGRKIALILGIISVYLCIQSIVAKQIEYAAGIPSYALYHLVQLVNVSFEQSIPAWYSSLMLLSASLLIALIARVKRLNGDRYVAHWIGLALLFTYLSIDESAAIHERLSEPLRTVLNTSGSLRFAWVLVGAPFALVIGLLYLRFLFHLPRRTRNLFILAGALYVTGALIVDPISANWYTPDEGITLTYWAIGTVEELLEMLGVVVLIYELLSYLGSYVQEVRIVNTGEKPPGIAPDDSHP